MLRGHRLSRRSLLEAAARLGVGAALSWLGLDGGRSQAQSEADEGPYFRESASTLTLGNRFYEVDFHKSNGAITRIFDKRGGGVVSEGNADGSLWGLARGAWSTAWDYYWPETFLQSRRVSASGFEWLWNADDGILTLDYELRDGATQANVWIKVELPDAPYIDLSARIENRHGPMLDWIDFPSQLMFDPEEVRRAVIPYCGGVQLDGSVFRERRRYTQPYPKWTAMADLIWIEMEGGAIAIYALHGASEDWQALLGIDHQQPTADWRSYWRHAFAIALEAGDVSELPTMRIRFSESPIAALSEWREDNGVDRYPSLRAKIGDGYEVMRRSPMILPNLQSGTFSGLSSIVDSIVSPAVLHSFGFQEQREWTYANDPDWWPPAEQFGGSTGYLDLFQAAQRDGMLVMPYTWPMNAHPLSPTASALRGEGLTLADIAAQTIDGLPLRVHGPAWWDPPDGPYLTNVSPSSTWYLARLDTIMSDHDSADSDLAFLDGFASPGWWYDDHSDAESPLRYSHGWLAQAQKHAYRNLTVEGNYDRMCEWVVAGYYSMYRWEESGNMRWAGNGWSDFPAASAMFRDKTLQCGDNFLGFSTWVKGTSNSLERAPIAFTGPEVLRRHLAQGQLLTLISPNWDATTHDPDPWQNLVSEFSHFIVGPHSDEIVTDFGGSFADVTQTVFESVTIAANWTSEVVSIGEHELAPSGVASMAHDGSATGGVFHGYNGEGLSLGDHYLIEQRKHNGVIVRQPMGSDTPLTIRAQGQWEGGSSVAVNVFGRRGDLLDGRDVRVRGSSVRFAYRAVVGDEMERRQFEAFAELGHSNVSAGIEMVEPWDASIVVERQGREARGFTSKEDWKPLSFRLTREISPLGSDMQVSVEYFDEVPVVDGESDSLHLSYANRIDSDVSLWHWDGEDTGNQTWKTHIFRLRDAVFDGRQWSDHSADFTMWVAPGYYIGKITVTNADELERRTVAYYTIHDPTQGETLTQGLHLRGWTDATQPIADLDLPGLQALYAWDADAASWLLYSPDVAARFNTLDTLEQGRAYYVRVRNGQTLHWPDAPYGGVGFHLQPGRNLVCWLGTPDKSLTDAIAPLRGMKAEPLVSVTLDGRTYDVEESRDATEPLPYGQALWVEIDAVGPTRWLQF